MDFDFDFLGLPVELQAEILLQEDLPTLYHLCQTSRHVRSLCSDEGLWRRMYVKDYIDQHELGDFKNLDAIEDFDNDLAQNVKTGSWLNKLKLMRMLRKPRKIFTFLVKDNKSVEQTEIIGNYQANDRILLRECIVDEYNIREEPVYTRFETTMTKYIEQPGVFSHLIEDFGNILNGDMLTVPVLFDVMGASEKFGTTYEIEKNYFFDLRDDFEDDTTFTLFVYNVSFGGALLTVAGSNIDKLYEVLASIMNFSSTYYSKYESHAEEQNLVQKREIAPTLNFIIHQLFELIDREEKAGLLKAPVTYNGEIIREIIEKSSLVLFKLQRGDAVSRYTYGYCYIVQGRLKSCPRVVRKVPESVRFSSLVPSHIPLPPPLNMGNVNMPALGPMPPPVRSGRPLPPPPPGAVVMPRQPVQLPRRAANLPPPPEDWIRMMMQQRK